MVKKKNTRTAHAAIPLSLTPAIIIWRSAKMEQNI